ncbi:MAG: Hpt domain-containing protein [Desulfuromonadales bacterium]
MTQRQTIMDMSHYRELFLSETREHIERLNELAVSLEEAPDQRQTIDALFRETHSIKGMAATMGFSSMATLAHHLEDLMDSCRSSGQASAAVIDSLCQGIDLLAGLLDDIQNDRPERDMADSLVPPGEQGPSASSAEPVATPDRLPAGVTAIGDPEAGDLTTAAAEFQETPACQVQVRLAEETPASAARCLLILRELEKIGAVTSSRPDITTLRQGLPCPQIEVWLQTTRDHAAIESALSGISSVASVRVGEDRRAVPRRENRAETRSIRVRTDLLDQFINLTGELVTQRNILAAASRRKDWDEVNQVLAQAERLIGDLHHQVLQARLMPLESITGRLPRIVRDLSRSSGKQVTLKMTGTEIGIDRVILEELNDPLLHLVRNAIDHGIEAVGEIHLAARREKETVIIEFSDNGKGMDPQGLRRKAVAGGLITSAQAEQLSDPDALMLICQPGFSTAGQVTDLSGRGVGMDVVKAAVNRLGGTLEISSEIGHGTVFRLRLPLSIAIIRILLVQCGEVPLAIPMTRVHKTLEIPGYAVQRSGRDRSFRDQEEDVTLVSLAEALGLSGGPATGSIALFVTERHGRRVGLQVDQFLGQREAYIKPVGFPLNRLTGLSGAVIEADGRVVFVIDPPLLLEKHLLAETHRPENRMPLRDFDSGQLETLKKISNIGMEQAAAALSQMLDRDIRLQAPQVSVTRSSQVADELGGDTADRAVGVALEIQGDAQGQLLLLLPQESTDQLLSLLSDNPGEALEMTEETASALKEVGNIVASAYLSALGNRLKKDLRPAIPRLANDTIDMLLDILLPSGDLGLQIETLFFAGGSDHPPVRGHVFLFPDAATVDVFLSAAAEF